jgi:hypothetical protein
MIYVLNAGFMPTEKWNPPYKLLDFSKKVRAYKCERNEK